MMTNRRGQFADGEVSLLTGKTLYKPLIASTQSLSPVLIDSPCHGGPLQVAAPPTGLPLHPGAEGGGHSL